MELRISNNAKVGNEKRTSMSQQQLINALLSEKQAVNYPQQNIEPVQPVQNWGGKK